jgi:hypothetical protein
MPFLVARGKGRGWKAGIEQFSMVSILLPEKIKLNFPAGIGKMKSTFLP